MAPNFCGYQPLGEGLLTDMDCSSWTMHSQLVTAFRAVLLTKSVGAISSAWREDIVVDASLMKSGIEVGVRKTYIVNEDPKVTLVPDFLSDVEVEALLSGFEGNWTTSGVGSSAVGATTYAGVSVDGSLTRTSCSAVLEWSHTPLIADIEARVADLAGMPVDNLEGMVGVRYTPGQFFALHHDGHHRPVTVFIYLNDLAEGAEGETRFPMLGLKFAPRKGAAIMWSNCGPDGKEDMRLCHLALPPRSGVKYGVNCFFFEFQVRNLQNDDETFSERDGRAEIHQWTVTLHREGPGSRLGIVIHAHQSYLIVDKVGEGFVADWNMTNPDEAVHVKDRIVGVNGESGDTDRLFNACQGEGILELLIERRRKATQCT